MTSAPATIEYLYAIAPGRFDADDQWIPAHLTRFRITKKTPKRIYYMRYEDGIRTEIGYVNRQKIEAEGEVCRASAGWWEDDFRLYLALPEVPVEQGRPDLAGLKAAMRDAHPDRGGSHADFIAARAAYERAHRATPPTNTAKES